MLKSKTENLIVKFLSNQASASDLDELEIWLQDSTNEQIFNVYVKTNYAVDYNMRKFDSKKVKNLLIKLMANERNELRVKRIRKIVRYSAAAIFIGVLTTSYFFKDTMFYKTVEIDPIIVKQNLDIIQPGTDKATLTLEDGSQIALEKGASFQTQNVNSNGEEIVYTNKNTKTSDMVYNYLTIPRGGQFYVKLSDGTQVWLNSESQLKYPVSFIKEETRKVELVYGEAYFDVSPSTEHNGAHFKVINNAQEVEVLGTEFNIKAYKDEPNIYTTLVEGKVAVNYAGAKQNLLPGQRSNLDVENESVTISIVDVKNEISWKQGVFSFREKPLKEIMKTISRWYDVNVIFENKELEEITFDGVLGKNQNIEEILSSIKTLSVIKGYEINKNKTIILK